MKRFLALVFSALVLATSTTLIAGSIVINGQKALACQIDDHTPRPYPTDSPRTHTG